jgi:hypothetical protein
MSSCLGLRRQSNNHGDREPLIPIDDDETSLQHAIHKKLHSYQMLRALTRGFMPSNEQTVTNLRILLSSDVLNPTTAGLSESGRKLAKYSKQFLQEIIDLLRDKNEEDKLQDFIWFIANTEVDVNTGDLRQTASDAKAKADARAGKFIPRGSRIDSQKF